MLPAAGSRHLDHGRAEKEASRVPARGVLAALAGTAQRSVKQTEFVDLTIGVCCIAATLLKMMRFRCILAALAIVNAIGLCNFISTGDGGWLR